MQTVAVLIFDQVNGLDITGPLEAFVSARDTEGAPLYRTLCWSLNDQVVTAESGLKLVGECVATPLPRTDILIVPGGAGLRKPDTLAAVAQFLRDNHAQIGRIASVCTGAWGLAASGLVDGQRLATHWRFAKALAENFPQIQVDADALFTQDGKFYSSGGITAGIDLALHIIAEDHGTALAAEVARDLVVHLRRTGAQSQFSTPLRFQTAMRNRIEDTCLWAAANLHADLSLTTLARHAGLSERQFSRLFRAAYQASPAKHILTLRLDAARTALSEGNGTIDQAAAVVGFQSSDGFRRAFERQFGITPSEYRNRFTLEGPKS